MQKLWRWLQDKVRGFTGTRYRVATGSDVPDAATPNTLHLVGDNGDYWQAIMRCPCGCGTDIHLPMSSTSRPRWSFSGTTTKPTLTPSVWRKSGCRSHFILRNGLVAWCK